MTKKFKPGDRMVKLLDGYDIQQSEHLLCSKRGKDRTAFLCPPRPSPHYGMEPYEYVENAHLIDGDLVILEFVEYVSFDGCERRLWRVVNEER